MSQPRSPGLEEAALESLLGDLVSYYQEEAEAGRLQVCRDAALTKRPPLGSICLSFWSLVRGPLTPRGRPALPGMSAMTWYRH